MPGSLPFRHRADCGANRRAPGASRRSTRQSQSRRDRSVLGSHAKHPRARQHAHQGLRAWPQRPWPCCRDAPTYTGSDTRGVACEILRAAPRAGTETRHTGAGSSPCGHDKKRGQFLTTFRTTLGGPRSRRSGSTPRRSPGMGPIQAATSGRNSSRSTAVCPSDSSRAKNLSGSNSAGSVISTPIGRPSAARSTSSTSSILSVRTAESPGCRGRCK